MRRAQPVVTTDYGGMMRKDVNEEAIAGSLDIVADNIYHGTQDHFDGSFRSCRATFRARSSTGRFW